MITTRAGGDVLGINFLIELLSRCYTVRNNLETIVEAIRHLEGDHMFSDDRHSSTPSSSPPSNSPRALLDGCSSSTGSPGGSQTLMEVPLALTATLSSSCQALPPGTTTFIVASPTGSGNNVTVSPLLKQHHMLNTVSRTVEIVEEQPINLEFRPGHSRSPSPFTSQASSPPSSSNPQHQQLRPGVIVVKHS
jgi:hypothetical protein